MMLQQWIWQCDRKIPSTAQAGTLLIDEVLRQLEHLQWSQRDIFAIHLALEEALNNAIKHGNKMDPAKKVHVRCRINRQCIQLEIADEGEGFDPSSLPDPTAPENLEAPTGRGIMLMRSFMSRVEFNDVGNAVFMEKIRSDA